MPTLQELIHALQQRPGVQAVVILDADGLVIETRERTTELAELLAARVPAVLRATGQLGDAAATGDVQLILIEFDQGYGIILRLSPRATLFVSTSLDVKLGELLFDLRGHRAPMATLV